MNLILCGMSGVGKTTVGKELELAFGLSRADTDEEIESRWGIIPKIFLRCGEAGFRNLERDVIKRLAAGDNLIISTGGGSLIFPENGENLKRNGIFFYLRASVETLEKRIPKDGTRPILNGSDSLKETLQKLLIKRGPIYEKFADYSIDTDHLTVSETADKIKKLWREKNL